MNNMSINFNGNGNIYPSYLLGTNARHENIRALWDLCIK